MELLEGSLPKALKLLGESLPKVLPNDPSQLALLHNNRIPTPLFEHNTDLYLKFYRIRPLYYILSLIYMECHGLFFTFPILSKNVW